MPLVWGGPVATSSRSGSAELQDFTGALRELGQVLLREAQLLGGLLGLHGVALVSHTGAGLRSDPVRYTDHGSERMHPAVDSDVVMAADHDAHVGAELPGLGQDGGGLL